MVFCDAHTEHTTVSIRIQDGSVNKTFDQMLIWIWSVFSFLAQPCVCVCVCCYTTPSELGKKSRETVHENKHFCLVESSISGEVVRFVLF
jgi:hypothetical protein